MVQQDLQFDSRASQKEAILSWLQAGNSITPLEALDRFRCLRLGGRCYDLRKEGYNIKSEMVKTASGKRVARYSLATE